MKLCFLAAADSVHSHKWIRYFANKGHEVHWISLTSFGKDRPANIACYDFSSEGSKWSGFLRLALRIRGLIADIKPDILHAHYAGTYGVVGALAGFQPYVLTAWGSDILVVGRQRLRGIPVRWALRMAKLITCDAYHMIDAMSALGVLTEKMHLIFFGIETDRFMPGAPDGEIIDRWHARGRPVVISLRSLEPVYDIKTILDAIPSVAKESSDVLFVIAGGGSEEAALKEHAAGLKLDRNILFTGRYAYAELPRMLHSVQAYVSSSLSDAGISASTAEAMSCGVAVVVTNTGENDKWIEEGKTGFLVPAHDSTGLAQKIAALLKDEGLRQRVGAAGRKVIEDRNSYAREMAKMEQLYRELAGAGGRTL